MTKKQNIWQQPWKYKEGILISISILILGFTLEYSTGGKGVLKLLEYPNNIYFGIGLIILLLLISTIGKKHAIVDWLGSIPAAICSIGLLLFVSLLMGLTMQYDNSAPPIIQKLGLSHVVSSWPYLLANVFLLLSLGATTIKNVLSFSWSKLGFMISHLGLWIVLFGANFGSLQVERLEMTIQEGGMSNICVDKSANKTYTMPFAIKLVDFILEEYNPKLALVNNETGKLNVGNGTSMILVDTLESNYLENWQITIKEYFYSSGKAGNRYYFNNEEGAAPSVLVEAKNPNGDMVGHTGVYEAAVKACEAVDTCIGRVVEALKEVGGECLITADHGNAEQMANLKTGQAHTAHTSEPVPFIYVGRDATPSEGKALSDVAPTMLHLMGMEQPSEMTGTPIMTLK